MGRIADGLSYRAAKGRWGRGKEGEMNDQKRREREGVQLLYEQCKRHSTVRVTNEQALPKSQDHIFRNYITLNYTYKRTKQHRAIW